eukprot:8273317-Karenia_brevis.AAC.1
MDVSSQSSSFDIFEENYMGNEKLRSGSLSTESLGIDNFADTDIFDISDLVSSSAQTNFSVAPHAVEHLLVLPFEHAEEMVALENLFAFDSVATVAWLPS